MAAAPSSIQLRCCQIDLRQHLLLLAVGVEATLALARLVQQQHRHHHHPLLLAAAAAAASLPAGTAASATTQQTGCWTLTYPVVASDCC